MANIPFKDKKQLWAKSGNICSFPECNSELCEEGLGTIVGEEAHIIAEEPNGPRGNPPLTIEERNRYDNLILLCKKHHKIIDSNPDTFTVEALHKYKDAHEQWVKDCLLGKDKYPVVFEDELGLNSKTVKKFYKWVIDNTEMDFTFLFNEDLQNALSGLTNINKAARNLINSIINYYRKKGTIDIPTIYGKLVGDKGYSDIDFFNSIYFLEQFNFLDFDDTFRAIGEDEEGNALIVDGEPTRSKYLFQYCKLGINGFIINYLKTYLNDKDEFKRILIDIDFSYFE